MNPTRLHLSSRRELENSLRIIDLQLRQCNLEEADRLLERRLLVSDELTKRPAARPRELP